MRKIQIIPQLCLQLFAKINDLNSNWSSEFNLHLYFHQAKPPELNSERVCVGGFVYLIQVSLPYKPKNQNLFRSLVCRQK